MSAQSGMGLAQIAFDRVFGLEVQVLKESLTAGKQEVDEFAQKIKVLEFEGFRQQILEKRGNQEYSLN